MPQQAHKPRPRRSRQCRGPRSRNYVRALSRAKAAKEHDDGDLRRVVAEADKSGALAVFRRQSKARTDHQLAKRRAAKDPDAVSLGYDASHLPVEDEEQTT